jgi:hypothetical protein
VHEFLIYSEQCGAKSKIIEFLLRHFYPPVTASCLGQNSLLHFVLQPPSPIPLISYRQIKMDSVGSKASGPFRLNDAPSNFCVHSCLLFLLIAFPVTTPPPATCFATSPTFLTPSKRSTNLFVPIRVEAIAGTDAALPPY